MSTKGTLIRLIKIIPTIAHNLHVNFKPGFHLLSIKIKLDFSLAFIIDRRVVPASFYEQEPLKITEISRRHVEVTLAKEMFVNSQKKSKIILKVQKSLSNHTFCFRNVYV